MVSLKKLNAIELKLVPFRNTPTLKSQIVKRRMRWKPRIVNKATNEKNTLSFRSYVKQRIIKKRNNAK